MVEFFKSKTCWGVLVFTLVSLAVQFGLVDAGSVTDVLKTLSGALTAYGIRDAL